MRRCLRQTRSAGDMKAALEEGGTARAAVLYRTNSQSRLLKRRAAGVSDEVSRGGRIFVL